MTLQFFENPALTAHGCRLVMYHKYLPLGVLNLPPHISSWSLIFHVSPPVTDNTDNTAKKRGGGGISQPKLH